MMKIEQGNVFIAQCKREGSSSGFMETAVENEQAVKLTISLHWEVNIFFNLPNRTAAHKSKKTL